MDENHINAQEFARITNVSRETFCLYEAWYNLLTHWNKTINLVSPSTIHNYWLRHALDSWQVFDGQETEAQSFNVLDLGSGAGFPGLAAAIRFRTVPNAHVYLVEANGKKCNFLRAVIRELGLPATAIQARAEHVPETLRNKHFNIITARAFAPLPKLLEYSMPYWSVDKLGSTHTQGIPPYGGMSGEGKQEARRANARQGMYNQEARSIIQTPVWGLVNTIGIFPKGRNWQQEVSAAMEHWEFDVEVIQSQTDEDAKILWVRNLCPHTDR